MVPAEMTFGKVGRDFDGEMHTRPGDTSQRGAESGEPGDSEHGFRSVGKPPGLTLEPPPDSSVLLVSRGSLLHLFLSPTAGSRSASWSPRPGGKNPGGIRACCTPCSALRRQSAKEVAVELVVIYV